MNTAGLAEAVMGLAAALVAVVSGTWLWRRAAVALRRGRDVRERIVAEDALKHVHAMQWQHGVATLESLAGGLGLSPRDTLHLVMQLEARGWLASHGSGFRLTLEGERLATSVIRAHRLWERYLADEARMPIGAIHAEAERLEHDRSATALQAMEAALGYPSQDPHGDPIPTARGDIATVSNLPLTDAPLDTPARIAHLEDEPEVVYQQLVADGLVLGQVVRVVERTRDRLVISDGEQLHSLAPAVAANVFVARTAARPIMVRARKLSTLPIGRSAVVRQLSDELRGFTRRRLLDLGMTPGVTVTAELRSLFGDPVAFRVRGTLIALRRDQADHVLLENE